MNDGLTSWLRTVVPGLWSALVAWLASLGLPAGMVAALGDLGHLLVVPVVTGAVYALLRAAEPRMPDWLTRVLLGSALPPTYNR